MADVELLQAEIEALRAEVERAHRWNERVSVCPDHVTDIVDGPCVICALAAAEARADNLQRELERLTAFNDDTCESFNRLSVERTALITRAEQLAEALRGLVEELGSELVVVAGGRAYLPERTFRKALHDGRAALNPTAAQEGKESFWPKLPGSGGPDWTGHD